MFFKYPGKLFLIGEFAIVETNSLAVVSAVNHFLDVTIDFAPTFEIRSSHGRLKGDECFTSKLMPHVHYSLKVLHQIIDMKPFKMVIHSGLEVDGVKVGFGSSGVVVVAVLDSVLRLHGYEYDPMTLFKLASLVQREMDEFSSGGDLAASVFKDTVVYQSYDRRWLKAQNTPIQNLIHMDWPYLKIEPLDFGDLFSIHIGWTGVPNITSKSTFAVSIFAKEQPLVYKDWLTRANKQTQKFIDAVHRNSKKNALSAIKEYRQLMLELGQLSGIVIETESLKNLIDLSPYPAKVSGSGGGDCGIVFASNDAKESLVKIWQDHNIKYIEGGTYHEHTITT